MNDQAKDPGKFIVINGVRTYFYEAGAGPPIVFVHGWALDSSYWKAQVDYFSQHYRAIAYDCRGAGKSGGGDTRFTTAQLADDLATLVEALELKRPVLCGHSFGGAIIRSYAVSNPTRLAALVFADSTAYTWKAKVGNFSNQFTLRLGKLLRKTPPQKLMVGISKRLFFSKAYVKTNPEGIDFFVKRYLANPFPGLIHSSRAWAGRADIRKQVEQLKVPALVIRGTEDKATSMSEAKFLHRIFAGSTLRLIEGSGHMVMVEKPVEFIEHIDTFLSGLELEKEGAVLPS